MTFARLILAASNNETVPKPTPFELPQRAEAMALIQYYLDNVFVLFPAFPETALFNAVDAVYQVNGRPVTEFEYWLLYMVLAIASTAQSRSSRDAYSADGLAWVGRALRYADKVLMPGYVSQIQALVLLVQYSMLDPAHFDSWQLIGFACRAIIDLGFHQDPPKEQQPDKNSLEMRRKLFYCVYSLDRCAPKTPISFPSVILTFHRSISMVHARAFSFTDDSTSVAYPSPTTSTTSSEATGNSLARPHSLEIALLLFQLRYAQSSWYQELFQSSRDPLQHASTYIWQMCQEMHEWAESLPETLPLAFKNFFDLELLYSYVYCLAPSCRVQSVSNYGKTLIFEYSIAYIEKIFPISRGPINTAFYTYHDALRVYFIGSQFLAVLAENQDQLLNGIISYAPVVPGSPPPPPLPSNAGGDNVDRSINCIAHIKETLRTFGLRWDDAQALQSSFETQAGSLLGILHRRKQHVDDISRNSHGASSFVQQPVYDPMGNVVPDDWSDMGSIFVNANILQGGLGESTHGLQ
jgi:hypothetical protein